MDVHGCAWGQEFLAIIIRIPNVFEYVGMLV